jgi:hypothetical protein
VRRANQVKADGRAINAILRQDWDPIGSGGPDDEYGAHVWPVYRLLRAGARRSEVRDYLARAALEALGAQTLDEVALRAALDKLMGLRLSDAEETP